MSKSTGTRGKRGRGCARLPRTGFAYGRPISGQMSGDGSRKRSASRLEEYREWRLSLSAERRETMVRAIKGRREGRATAVRGLNDRCAPSLAG